MPSSYPAGLDTLAANKADATLAATDHPTHHNDLANSIMATQVELGINPSASYATVAAAIAAAHQSIDATLGWSLETGVAAGVQTIDLGRNPPTGFVNTMSYVAVGAGLATCELRSMSSVNGSLVTLNTPLVYAHSLNESVVWLPEAQVPITFWGVRASTDGEHYKIQRAISQATSLGLWLDGMNKAWLHLSQPLLFPNGARPRHINFKAQTGGAQFAPLDTNTYMAYSMQGNTRTFTASAATNEITTALAHGVPSDGIAVVFQAQGETFPGGLTEGRLYYAYERVNHLLPNSTLKVTPHKTVTSASVLADATTVPVTDASMFPSSGTLQVAGGATFTYTGKTGSTAFTGCVGTPVIASGAVILGEGVDITSDGAGTVFCEVLSLTKLQCDWMFFHASAIAGLNGCYFNLQQQSLLNHLRVDQTSTANALQLKGQQSNLVDLEIVGSGTGLIIANGGKFINCYGGNIETMSVAGVRLEEGTDATLGTANIGFFGMHFENCPIYYHVKHCAGLTVQSSHVSLGTSAETAIKVEAASINNVSYVAQGLEASGGAQSAKWIDDVTRGYSILLSEAPGSGIVFPSISQPMGANTPVLGWRKTISKTNVDYTAVFADDTILMNATSAIRTCTLPTAVGVAGKRFTVKRINSAAFNVVVAATGGQTFDGAATVTLAAQYDRVTVESDGANWMRVD